MTNSTRWLKAMKAAGSGGGRQSFRSGSILRAGVLMSKLLTTLFKADWLPQFHGSGPARPRYRQVKVLKRFPKNAKMASAIHSWNRSFRRDPTHHWLARDSCSQENC